jgi:rubrerythrin
MSESSVIARAAGRLIATRRSFLTHTGTATLSAAAVALIAGRETMAQGMGDKNTMGDVNILNTALGLEHEAINAYQLGAESGLLQQPVMNVAVTFQGHHKEHRDALIATIRKLGGTPVAEKSKNDYAMALNASTLKSQADVLHLAQKLERGAANAYIGVIPAFSDKGLSQVAARLAADESMHWTALTSALAEMLPQKALTFGA